MSSTLPRIVVVEPGAGPLVFAQEKSGAFGGAELQGLRTARALATTLQGKAQVVLITVGPHRERRTQGNLLMMSLGAPGTSPHLAAWQKFRRSLILGIPIFRAGLSEALRLNFFECFLGGMACLI